MSRSKILGCFVFIGLFIVNSVALSASSEIKQNVSADEKNSKIVLTTMCDAPTSREDCMQLDDKKYHEKQVIKREGLNKTSYKTIAPLVNSSPDGQKPERETANSVGRSLLSSSIGRILLSSDAIALLLFVFISSAILIRRLG